MGWDDYYDVPTLTLDMASLRHPAQPDPAVQMVERIDTLRPLLRQGRRRPADRTAPRQ